MAVASSSRIQSFEEKCHFWVLGDKRIAEDEICSGVERILSVHSHLRIDNLKVMMDKRNNLMSVCRSDKQI